MSVVVAHEVRRCPVLSPNLDDLGRLVGYRRPGRARAAGHLLLRAWQLLSRVLSSSLYLRVRRRKRDELSQARTQG